MKRPITDARGFFSFVIRNPFDAINSMFCDLMKSRFDGLNNQVQVFDFINQIDSDSKKISVSHVVIEKGKSWQPNDFRPIVDSEHALKDEESLIIKTFCDAAAHTIFYNFVNWNFAGRDFAIKFEEIVSSSEYFKSDVLPKINPGLSSSKFYLEAIFAIGRYNSHANVDEDSKPVLKNWLGFQRRIFDAVLNINDINLKPFYEDMGYTSE